LEINKENEIIEKKIKELTGYQIKNLIIDEHLNGKRKSFKKRFK